MFSVKGSTAENPQVQTLTSVPFSLRNMWIKCPQPWVQENHIAKVDVFNLKTHTEEFTTGFGNFILVPNHFNYPNFSNTFPVVSSFRPVLNG